MKNLKLPVSIEDFQEIRNSEFYYIDKTGLIEQLLDNWGKLIFLQDHVDLVKF